MRIFAVVLFIVCLLAGLPAPMRAQVDSTPQLKALDQPSGWVPFAADLAISRRGLASVLGRFYRASGGSTRVEKFLGGRTLIRINNMTLAIHYLLNPADGSWIAQPMRLSVAHQQPPQVYETPTRRPLPGKIEGLDVYEWTVRDGRFLVQAPALNFFTLVSRVEQTGYAETYTNVRIGEQPSGLFVPPAGAAIALTPEAVSVTTKSKP